MTISLAHYLVLGAILIAISVLPVYVLLIRPEARSYRRST